MYFNSKDKRYEKRFSPLELYQKDEIWMSP